MGVDDSFTKALLHFNGSDGSTTFTDESGKTWTPNGTAQITTAQSVFGGSSALLNTAGVGYLTGPSSSDWDFTGVDWTIDVRARAAWGSDKFLFSGDTAGDLFFGFLGSNIGIGRAGIAWDYAAPHGMVNDTWNHIAMVKAGTLIYAFINGIQVGTTGSNSINYKISGNPCIGAQGYSFFYIGYEDELRVSKGIARWTSNFTPPTSEYAPSGGPPSAWVPRVIKY